MARAPRKTTEKKTKKRASALTDRHVPLSAFQSAWVDSIVDEVAAAGGPTFTREQVLHALVDAAVGRKLDPGAIKSADDLRRAFGAIDLRSVEKMLKDRPRMEEGLLKALEDTIK